jgi:hypothetical protein
VSPGLTKWTLFAALFLTVPALLFLVQVVMFLPAVFYLAGMLLSLGLAVVSGSVMQSLVIFTFLGIHVALQAGIYYLVAALAAKAIALIPWSAARNAAVAVICAGLAGLTLLPVYGSGGHGTMRWMTLQEALADLGKRRWAWVGMVVYGVVVLAVAAALFLRWRKERREASLPVDRGGDALRSQR